jgi:predicted pyridoxine 5'-phosphate oxidase superfamily flavin-nucleotide-binding protein
MAHHPHEPTAGGPVGGPASSASAVDPVMHDFLDIALTPSVVEHQRRHGRALGDRRSPGGHAPRTGGLDPDEVEFLRERDSFYLASVAEDGWPYVQHRGGPAGFVRVIGPSRIAWAELPGNRQYLTAGHLETDDRVAIIAVDYPTRRRLKLLGHARYLVEPTAEQVAAVVGEGTGDHIDGIVEVDVVATAWNCPKHITPRFTAEQVRTLIDPRDRRIAELEAQLAALT